MDGKSDQTISERLPAFNPRRPSQHRLNGLSMHTVNVPYPRAHWGGLEAGSP